MSAIMRRSATAPCLGALAAGAASRGSIPQARLVRQTCLAGKFRGRLRDAGQRRLRAAPPHLLSG